MPAVDSRVGVPYGSAQAMGAAATVRGAEVLRRELKQVADPQMRDIRIVIADVGSVGKAESVFAHSGIQSLENSVHSWTVGEQKVYGSPYATFLSTVGRRTRLPSRVDIFVHSIVQTIGKNALKGERASTLAVGFRLWTFKLLKQIRGSRICVGAGGWSSFYSIDYATELTRITAVAYTLASYLPDSVLDTLLNLPAHMGYPEHRIEISPIEPTISNELSVGEASELTEQDTEGSTAVLPESAPKALDTSVVNSSANGSESESRPAGVESSWISVQD